MVDGKPVKSLEWVLAPDYRVVVGDAPLYTDSLDWSISVDSKLRIATCIHDSGRVSILELRHLSYFNV